MQKRNTVLALILFLFLALACGKDPYQQDSSSNTPLVSDPSVQETVFDNGTIAWIEVETRNDRGPGYVATPLGGYSTTAGTLVLQTNGKFVWIGSFDDGGSFSKIALLRFEINGVLDTSFATDGSVALSFSGLGVGDTVAIQPDGRIVAFGNDDYSRFAIARFTTNGELDTSFHSDGRTTFTIIDSSSRALGAVQTDAKILVAGGLFSGGTHKTGIARLNSNGLFDTSFNTRGHIARTFTAGGHSVASILLQSDGAIVTSYTGVLTDLARFNTNGSLDTSFSSDGFTSADGISPYAVSLLTDGKLLAFGISTDVLLIVRYLTNGQFDTSFGTGNPVSFNSTAVTAFGSIDENGRALVAYTNFGVLRYHTNGTLDTAFSNDGNATINLTSVSGSFQLPYAAGMQTDGRFMVAGTYIPPGFDGNPWGFARVNTDGSLDTSFVTDGTTLLSYGKNAELRSIMLSPTHIVAAGWASTASANRLHMLARYEINSGRLDTSFATVGYLKTTTTYEFGRCGLAQPDGRYIVVGDDITPDFIATRYNSNGTFDTSFHSDGKFTTNMSGTDTANACGLQTDGKIFLVGNNTADFHIARLNTNGTLDTTFDRDGKIAVNVSGTDNASAAIIQTDGNLVVIGNQGTSDFALVRITSNGALDTAFDLDGRVSTNISGNDIAYAGFLQEENIVVAGNQGSGNIVVARYRSNGALDTTFAVIGRMAFDFSGSDIVYAAAGAYGNKIYVAGEDGSAFSRIAIGRILSSGALDTSFRTSGKWTSSLQGLGDHLYSLAIDPLGQIIAGGVITNDDGPTFMIVKISP